MYVAWIVLVPVTLVVALVWSRDRTGGAWFVTAVAVDWVLGVATYFAVPTLGPVYAQPQDFAALPHTYVSTLQEAMIQDRHTVLYDPFATHAVQTIAAFASLHVGIMVTVCLMAELLGMQRWVRVTMWVFLGADRARDGLPRLALLRRHPRRRRARRGRRVDRGARHRQPRARAGRGCGSATTPPRPAAGQPAVAQPR